MTATGLHVMRSVIDLESGQGAQAAPHTEVLMVHDEAMGGSDSAFPVREAEPVVSQVETLDDTSSSPCCCIPSGVFRPFTSMRGEGNIDHSQHSVNDTTGEKPTQAGQRPQAEAQTSVASNPTFDSDPRITTSDPASEQEPRMIGDFDGSSNALWTLFRDEAKSHDDARINTLKDDMEGSLIFAGLFSAALTAFVIDSKQDLKPSHAEETVYYLRQHSIILSQISVQLSSIAPQVSIPSTPLPPFPSFHPSASVVRVNVFWFMALTFSLLAALLAILIQQWVRDYMHVFQRYGNPLKSARLRQYLYEGCEGWHMLMVAEAVPGFLHISLFLFFTGLGNSLLNISIKVALSTIIPISIIGLLYILITIIPIVYPQSPYQNPFTGVIWYLVQKFHGRRFRERGSNEGTKPVDANMAQGQMQLAIEETVMRKDRDVRAIRWLIDNLTEDAEMEKFLSAIPGSFNTDWGTEVWKRVGKHHESEDQSQDEPVARPHGDTIVHRPSSSWSIRGVLRPIVHLVRKPAPNRPPTHGTTRSRVSPPPNVHPHSTTARTRGENVVHELSTRVARFVEICKNRKHFANDGLWQKRTQACIETTASLVCCANAKLAWFGDIAGLLGDIGSFENIRELSLAGTDELFVMRWTCLSLVAIRQMLEDSQDVRFRASLSMYNFADDADDNDEAAQRTDGTLQKAKDCLFRLYDALHKTKDLTEDIIIGILRRHESQISELEQINIEADRLKKLDSGIFRMQYTINNSSRKITCQIPGVLDNLEQASIPFSRFVEVFCNPHKLQFICPGQTVKIMCSPATTLRNFVKGKSNVDAYKELLKDLEKFRRLFGWQGEEMQRQLWRLQDLHDGGGLGFTVELFFLALSQLLSTSSSKESHSALYTGTFRAITSDWSKHKHSLGMQKLLLDVAMIHFAEFYIGYPAYIVDEFLLLLGNVFEGQTGPHIDKARQKFDSDSFEPGGPRRFRERVLRILTLEQAGTVTGIVTTS